MPESIVIAAARRTPIGGFQGIFSPVSATQLGSVAAAAALADAGLSPDAIDEVIFGCVLPAGLGQAPGAAGGRRCRYRHERARHDRQQDVRLGDEGSDAGGRPDPRRLRAHRPRGRPRVDDQCAVPHAESARRLSHGSRRDLRPHVLRRPAEPLGRQGHGLLRGRRPPPSTVFRARIRTRSPRNPCVAPSVHRKTATSLPKSRP